MQIEERYKDSLKLELEKLDELYAQFNIDKIKLRRHLRGILGQGSYHHTENVIHRSKDCKNYFGKAAEIAQSHNSQNINVFHILIALVNNSGMFISKATLDFGIKVEDFKIAAERFDRELNEPVNVGIGRGNEQVHNAEKSKPPFLDKYGRDLTSLARENKIGPIIERRAETLQIIRTLTRKTKKNPVLIGNPGVGKTAIVEGLALRIARGNLTQLLRNKRVIELNIGSLVAGTKYRGEFEERLNRIILEASSIPDIILFIDEIHTLIGAGSAEGVAMDAADIMKPALGRGDITCIGATTIAEYRKYIEKDPALERRFQPIIIKEPSFEETINILSKLYESRKEVQIDSSAIRAAVDLSVKYIHDRQLPDKAIDILEEACSRVKVPELSIYGSDDKAAIFNSVVTAEIVANVVSDLTGIPVQSLSKKEKERFINMSEIIKERVIGQDEAVEKISQAIRMQMAGLKDTKKPIGVFLFLGPTGVGKTELAKALAEFLFGSDDEIIRIDMSEFMEKHTISKLIGAPPGYIGHDEEGLLTGRLRNKPYSVVLLDEIEKAHPDIFNLFLQVFDEGRLTDSKGRTIDAKNALFIMTSNIGTEFSYKEPIGFIHPGSGDGITIREDIQSKLKQTFRKEFLNRIDEVIFFKPLEQDALIRIATNMLDELRVKLELKGIQLDIKDKALELLLKEGYDPLNGARPLKRALERLVVKPLSERLLKNEFIKGDLIIVSVENGVTTFRKVDYDQVASEGEQLLKKKKEWIYSMETGDSEFIYKTLEKSANINELVRNYPNKELAIMFTDLKDCVVYFENKGTILAMKWIKRHNDILTPIIESHGGSVLKNICDAMMAIFEDSNNAVRAAVEIQKAIKNYNEKVDETEQYHIRISLNAGRVSLNKGDVFGKAVNIAARIEKLTSSDQILIGQNLYELLSGDLGLKINYFSEETLKGVRGKVKIYEVLWNDIG